MTRATGRCLCGAVTLTIDRLDDHFHACHCGMCRRWAGGPVFAVHAEGLRIEGGERVRAYRSSDWAERAFCTECGSNLFYRLVETDTHLVCAGVLDDASGPALGSEIFIDSKPDSYALAGDHPRLTAAEVIAAHSKKNL